MMAQLDATLMEGLKKLKLSASRAIAERVPEWTFDVVIPANSRRWSASRVLRRLLVKPERVAVPLLGPIAFQMLRTGCQIGLFERLEIEPGMTQGEIQEAFELTEHSGGVLLLGLCSLKLIHRIGERYYNDPFLVKVLLKNFSDGFTDKWLNFMQHLVAPAAMYLPESIQKDEAIGLNETLGRSESFYQSISMNPEVMRHFDTFMRATTSINENQVAALADFADKKTLIDVGGGTGNLALALAKHQPQVEVTTFDFPKVVELAEKHFQESPYADRLKILAGNIQEGAIPKGFDCVIFSHFMGVFSEEVNLENVRKAYDSLESGGSLCLFTPVCSDNQSGPVTTGLFSSYFLFLANGNGRFYSAESYERWMTTAGFRNIKKISLPAHEAVFFGEKP